MMFIAASFDTTAHVLVSTLYYLHIYPEWKAKVMEEIKQVLNSDIKNINKENLEEMIILGYILKESQRMDGVGPLADCLNVYKEFELDGIVFKEGTNVKFNLEGLHKNPT